MADEQVFTLKDFKGLEPFDHSMRNSSYLVRSSGSFVFEGMLQSVPTLTRINTGSWNFPYPQLFVLSDVILVCSGTDIYEYTPAGGLSASKINVTEGSTWSVVDRKTWVWLTNGKVNVIRDSAGNYSLNADLPHGTCLCDFNGQIFVGSPDVDVSGDI